LHANYSARDIKSDTHLPHRYAQLFELAQFVKFTSDSAHMSILMGDLNTSDYEIGYKILTDGSKMIDAFKEKMVEFLYSIINGYLKMIGRDI
jgi:hypothetical protein